MTADMIIAALEDLPTGKYKVIQMVIHGRHQLFWSSDDRPHSQMLEAILDESGLKEDGRMDYKVAGMGLCRCKSGVSQKTRLWHLHFGGSSILLNHRINYDHLKAYVKILRQQGIVLVKMD